MTDILLAKPILSSDEIDLSVGEGTLTRNNLFKFFPSLYDPTILSLGQGLETTDFEYAPPAGYKPLIDLLEEKHQAPVIITNGAKQALGASFAALKKKCIQDLYLQPIYWALLPPLARFHGLDVAHAVPNDWERFKSNDYRGAYLLLSPNNPSGETASHRELTSWTEHFQDKLMPLIHDAAYYTHSYLPADTQLVSAGDLQIFSFSKMLGLSAARGGYVVCHDTSYYKDIVAYQEMMTVGVSILTQKYLYTILNKMNVNPETTKAFEAANFQELKQAKRLLREVPKAILDVPENIEETFGMFAWVNILDKEAFKKAKIHIVSGEPFGDADKVRLNLGVPSETLKECVKRLNEVAS